MKRNVATDRAPAAIGPYAQAVEAGGLVFVSGQIPLDPASGQIAGGPVAEQTERVLRNIEAILAAAGLTMDHMVKATVYLTDLADFGAMNEVYARFFPRNPPARATIQVAALPKGVRIEIDAIACR